MTPRDVCGQVRKISLGGAGRDRGARGGGERFSGKADRDRGAMAGEGDLLGGAKADEGDLLGGARADEGDFWEVLGQMREIFGRC